VKKTQNKGSRFSGAVASISGVVVIDKDILIFVLLLCVLYRT
jgi:hypothetical protein